MRQDRKELLDKIGFTWKRVTLAARASTTDVRGLLICIISRFGETDRVSQSRIFPLAFVWNLDLEAFNRPSSVGLPNEAPPEGSEPAQGHGGNKRPSLNKKQPITCPAMTGQMAATANQRGNATDTRGSVETDCGLDDNNPNPSPVTGSALTRGCSTGSNTRKRTHCGLHQQDKPKR
jgi:hypothetical protein